MTAEGGERPEAPEDDWESRRLCSDGNCIGVIGPDGRCKECGRPAEEPVGRPGPPSAPAPEPGPAAPAGGSAAPSSAPPEAAEEEWESRRLCSDGNCIGVIGPDGRCKECGKPYAG